MTDIIKLKKEVYNLNQRLADFQNELDEKNQRIGFLEDVSYFYILFY